MMTKNGCNHKRSQHSNHSKKYRNKMNNKTAITIITTITSRVVAFVATHISDQNSSPHRIPKK